MYGLYILFVLSFIGERANHTLKKTDRVVFAIIHLCIITTFVTLGYNVIKTIVGFF